MLAGVATHSLASASGWYRGTGARSAQAFELRNAAGADPFGDEDAAVMAEAGVVGVDKLAAEPFGLIAADRTAVGRRDAGHVVSQAGDDFVLRVQQREPRVQLGDD